MAGRKRTAAENAEETEKLRIACETALKNALERALSAKDSGASADTATGKSAKKKIVHDEPVCRFEYAYAITCHKAQGSEFDYVIVFDESWAFGEERRRWLYTAVTRAKEKLIIVR